MLQLLQVHVVHVVEHGDVARDRIQLERLLQAVLLAAPEGEHLLHGIVVDDLCVNVEQLKATELCIKSKSKWTNLEKC